MDKGYKISNLYQQSMTSNIVVESPNFTIIVDYEVEGDLVERLETQVDLKVLCEDPDYAIDQECF